MTTFFDVFLLKSNDGFLFFIFLGVYCVIVNVYENQREYALYIFVYLNLIKLTA